MKDYFDLKALVATAMLVALAALYARAVNYTFTVTSANATSSTAYQSVKSGYYMFHVRVTSTVGSSPTLQVGVGELGAISSNDVAISSYTSLSDVTNITANGLYTFNSDILVGGSIRVNYAISNGTYTFTLTAREINP